MTDALWTLDRVTLHGDDRPRLDDVSLAIHPGVTAVLGQSGAGKTSLLNLFVGFEQPDTGVIHRGAPFQCAGKAPLFWSPPDFGLWPHLTVMQHLTMVAPQSSGDIAAAAAAMLDELALASLADARPDRLSQGERSRLSVARALMSRASVLVMDEPLAHVDPGRVPQFWSVIRRHVADIGASLIFSTHDASTVLGEAQWTICLREGRVVYAGEVSSLYANPPSHAAAVCLGEVNWFEGGEASAWLPDCRDATSGEKAVRPEHLEVEIDPAGAAIVESMQSRGPTIDVHLKHCQSGAVRRFVCRSGAAVNPGERVRLRVLPLVLALIAAILPLLAGCQEEGEPAWPVAEFRFFSMPPDADTLPTPRGVAIVGDEVLVLDKAGRVLIFDGDGQLQRQWWMPLYEAGKPEGACLLKDGRIAVADTHYGRVVIFDPDGNVATIFGSVGREAGQFIYPVKVVQDDAGFLYVLEYGGNDRVQKFTPEGKHVLTIGATGTQPGQLSRPGGIAWHAGKLYIADADNNRVQVFSDDGKFLKVLDNEGRSLPLDFPYDLSIGPDGLLYVIEYGAGRLTVLTTDGKLMGRYGSAGRGAGQFSTPWGVRVDQQGRVWIADTGNRRLVRLTKK